MKNGFREIVEDCPVIATVKDEQSMEKSFESDSQIVFILFGDICNIASIVERAKARGRIAMVHLDLVSGFDGREIAVDYIKNMTRADGIISTKTSQINRAKELGLYAVHRFLCWTPVRWKTSASRARRQNRIVLKSFRALCPRLSQGLQRRRGYL